MNCRAAVPCLVASLVVGCTGSIGVPSPEGEGAGASSQPGAAPSGASCADGQSDAHAGPSLTLNDRQLANTLQALFPFELQLPELPERPRAKHAFSTGLVSNEFTFNQVAIMADAADAIAVQAMERLDQLMPCAVAQQGAACLARFVDDFGAQAYRRPLEPPEHQAMVDLYTGLTDDGLDARLATAAVISALLQSPQFLYQLDLGAAQDSADEYRLTSHEVASHLSYLITDSPPDAELEQLAGEDGLADVEVVRNQARRLLNQEAGHELLKRFVLEWFDVADADYSSRVDAALADALMQELDRNLQAWFVADASTPLTALLSSSSTHVNRTLAEHYGLPTDGFSSDEEWQQRELPAHFQGGLLTKPAVAARFSNLENPSIILRGVFVITELMCEGLGTPPNNAVDLNPQLPPGSLPRDKSEARTMLNPCGTCHSKIDPIGLGMEELDQLGRHRSEYESGDAVDNRGDAWLLDPPQFSGTAELAQRIAGSDLFLQCAAEQWSEYAFGERLSSNSCTPDHIAEMLRSGNGSMQELILAIVDSGAFLTRRRDLQGEGAP